MATDKPKTMPIFQFRDQGYLMEANRLFFHPLGLALAVTWCDHKDHPGDTCRFKPRLGPILDYRDDPEGMLFGEAFTDEECHKSARIDAEFAAKLQARAQAGCDPESGIQPMPTEL